jgi:hypothetical protein
MVKKKLQTSATKTFQVKPHTCYTDDKYQKFVMNCRSFLVRNDVANYWNDRILYKSRVGHVRGIYAMQKFFS